MKKIAAASASIGGKFGLPSMKISLVLSSIIDKSAC